VRRWELTFALDANREQPLFLQLATAVADDIRRGRLKPGEPLPSSRALAERLRVNRNTVVAAYAELVAEGLVHAQTGGGTFVAEPAHLLTTPPALPTESPTYVLPPSLESPQSRPAPRAGMLMMSRGEPDVRLLPTRSLARAFAHAIGDRGGTRLTYADPSGDARLRAELATMLSRTRGLVTTQDDVLITRGSEHGIDLVARMLLQPGDAVAVEAFGYPPAWSVLKLAGARLLPVPLDDDGLDVGALEKVLAKEQVRAVFVTPHHQFPTTTVMSSQRRARLSELALRQRFAIIEDDYDHEFHYEGETQLPIAAGPGRANAIYVGSLANLLAPGLNTGFIVAPPPVLERLVSLRAASDAQGDAAVEGAIADLFEEGELLRHVRRMRRTYAARRDALAAALVRHLGHAVDFRPPKGGMALWARVDGAIDVAEWARAGEREGVIFCDSRRYDLLQREQPYVRLGFTYHDEAELEEAARRMARALKRMRTSPSATTPTRARAAKKR
jgi:GntR family transcriptional regulator/MocR family aminotransferase